MDESLLETLRANDTATLLDVVRQDQRSPTFEIIQWSVEHLSDQGIMNPNGLFLFSGEGHDEQGARPWSVVLKIIKASEEEQDPTNLWYWKRELLVAQSGLLATLPPSVVPPRSYKAIEQAGSGWIWTEYIVATSDKRWTTDDYVFAARQLGRFNGPYLTGTPLPDFPWLCKRHARTWTNFIPPDKAWDNPFVTQFFSDTIRERVLQLWDERERFYETLERLPQVFSHFDYHRRNLFIRSRQDEQNEVIAVDWAQCGCGAIGADLKMLVGDSATLFELDLAELPEVEAASFEAYIAGLRNVGWEGDPDIVRLGYTVWFALWIGIVSAPLVFFWTADDKFPSLGRAIRRSREQYASGLAALCEYALDRADEARALMDKLM
jgi:hypothetical protein